ncbi:LysM peptidoglycan-binding domain-containing protein [Flavobacterium sp. HBTb2-11-1]|uniref:LysM peptidoglycan-binding domain-containing protein n=1 Tax=Flavobacterium sp. HBTb2-11-1 TaxID=2692212 RepID=UPI00136CE3A3|nr:LysM peptidoglycan-binding domain-containing protein [Flavobacterium sp. HBTb2-11-1]MXO05611.1 peptidoglycan-binding protein LysM [Flavobacterium sp. HBTb2-11-1]
MYYIDKPEKASYDKFHIYKIKKGDTLESVARDLGMDAQELRRYHNMYCEIPDLIEADFKSYLEYLILAPEKSIETQKEQTEKKTQKVSLASNYTLPFVADKINNDYQVNYTTVFGDAVDTIEMKVSVKWLATDRNNYHLFEINKGSIYVNNSIPDTIMDELAAKTAAVLYPLKIVVDQSGKWVDIYNYDEIENRWKDTKDEVLDYFEGEVAENYIEQTEYALENSETLLSSLASDYFLRAFFSGIYVGYTSNYSFQNEVFFPLEKDEESKFAVQQKIDSILDESNLVKVEQKGDYIDSGSEASFGFDPWKGKFKASYFLDEHSYCIEKIDLECNIEYDEPIKVIVQIESLKKEETQK